MRGLTLLRFPKYKYYFAFSDLLILSISFIITAYLNESSGIYNPARISGLSLLLVFLSMILSYSFISGSMDMYKINIILTKKEHTAALTKVILYVTMITAAAYVFSFSFYSFNPRAIFSFGFITFVLFYLFRIEIFPAIYMKIGVKRNILLVGEEEYLDKISGLIKKEKVPGINIKHFIHLDHFNGNRENLNKLIADNNVDEIMVGSNESSYSDLISIIELCREQNVSVKLFSEKFKIIPERLSVEKFFDLPMIDFTRKYDEKTLRSIKRIVDAVLSLLFIVLFSPMFLLLAIIIKSTSKGPVLYKQKRIGLNGREFMFYKFRSMYEVKGEDETRKLMMLDYMKNNRAQKIVNDSRVTAIGKIIRKTSIDELPQLLNVLKGDMSLVGPRPSLPYEYENYEPWQKKRVSVIPGCTGIWQVSGRSSVSFTDSILMDLYYVNNMSPVMDIKLILKTIPVMAFSRGGK